MTLAQALSTYINLNLLIVVGFLALAAFSLITQKTGLILKAVTDPFIDQSPTFAGQRNFQTCRKNLVKPIDQNFFARL